LQAAAGLLQKFTIQTGELELRIIVHALLEMPYCRLLKKLTLEKKGE